MPQDLPESARQAIELLEALVEDRQLLAAIDEDTRRRLLIAAGRVSRPGRAEQRGLAKAFRKKDKAERREDDRAKLDAAGIRRLRSLPVFPTPPPVVDDRDPPEPPPTDRLHEPRRCYVCKERYDHVHSFYDQLCVACGDFNYAKRSSTADLRGRVALVSGGRVKIGYQASILLLRAGARVIVTTRFPRDATDRFAREADFAEFADRLVIYGLDLRHTPSVETFARRLIDTEARLDFIIHNACQTVRRPSGFYAHLLEAEGRGSAGLNEPARRVLEAHESLRASLARPGAVPVGLIDAPGLSQLALLEEDHWRGGAVFPEGLLDADLQQRDLRSHNSWRAQLHEVSTVELLEVQLVNAIAPFVLNAKLKPLMLRERTWDKHIVNVSAMEGQFYRQVKTDKHPHTNMAKAALNMMTRTSAQDYAQDGVHMNSVDTGWVSEENPAETAERKRLDYDFHPPLDVVDGAARICDPIFDGFNTGVHRFGLFFKDYQPTVW